MPIGRLATRGIGDLIPPGGSALSKMVMGLDCAEALYSYVGGSMIRETSDSTRNRNLSRFDTIRSCPPSGSKRPSPPAPAPSPAQAMLRLRSSILIQVLSSSSVAFPNISSLHRLLSAAAALRISPNPSFAVGDYLVDTCGLTRTQALKASAKLSHLKTPSKPDAVRAFLAGLGLSSADIAAAVVKDPLLLCAGLEKTLSPVVAELTGLGLSLPDIARLMSLARDRFRSKLCSQGSTILNLARTSSSQEL